MRFWERLILFKEGLKRLGKIQWWLMGAISAILALLAFLIAAGYILDSWRGELNIISDKIILKIPVIDLRFLTRCGIAISIILFIIGCAQRPLIFFYCLLMVPWWFFWRVLFGLLAPAAPPPGALDDFVYIKPSGIWHAVSNILNSIFFFSGHTALPIYGGLIFGYFFWWKIKKPISYSYLLAPLLYMEYVYFSGIDEYPWWLGAILFNLILIVILLRKKKFYLHLVFFIWAALMAAAVLFTHQHYVVDVLAAPFMAIGLFFTGHALFRGVLRSSEFIENKIEEIKEIKKSK